ncbi:MAG TPA: ATP-binding protein [Myxococcota bacterium]|nr:ATP-binding protein [Myxococcota bacterium]
MFGGLLLLLGGTAFVLLDRGLRTNLDDSLASVARAIAASSREAGGPDLADTLESMLGPSLAERFFQLLDPFGRPDPRLSQRGRWTFPLSSTALRNAEEGRETFESIRIPGASTGDVRLLTLPVIDRGRLVHFVQVAASLERVDQARSRFLLVMLSLAPLALAGAALGGWFLAGRALSPVDAMVAAARRISAEDLSMRLAAEDRDDELGRLAAVLNDMLARLERSFTTARQFSADAAHELRTPLTILKGELEVALHTATLGGQGQEMLESCLEEVDRLAALVEDLLFLARADADVVPFQGEPVDLAALAREVEPALRVLAERAGVGLAIDAPGPVVVKGSEPLLLRVLFNLAENGIKYAGAGQRVDLAVRCDREEGLLEVRDSGPGIASEERERIFDRFYRADPARERSGTGLGLPLVRSIVRLHAGEICVESEPGSGSCFRVRLPLAESPPMRKV